MHLIVLGAGGHAKVVLDAAEQSGAYSQFSFVDPHTRAQTLGRHQVFRKVSEVQSATHFVVAIGDNELRRNIFFEAIGHGLLPSTIVHPRAIVAPSASIGAGTVALAGVVINAEAIIGRNCIINTGAIVEHDCRIGDHVHVAPGSTMAGGVDVGDNSLIGVGSTVIPYMRVGANCTVAAGAVVVDNVEDGSTVFGVPARSKIVI